MKSILCFIVFCCCCFIQSSTATPIDIDIDTEEIRENLERIAELTRTTFEDAGAVVSRLWNRFRQQASDLLQSEFEDLRSALDLERESDDTRSLSKRSVDGQEEARQKVWRLHSTEGRLDELRNFAKELLEMLQKATTKIRPLSNEPSMDDPETVALNKALSEIPNMSYQQLVKLVHRLLAGKDVPSHSLSQVQQQQQPENINVCCALG